MNKQKQTLICFLDLTQLPLNLMKKKRKRKKNKYTEKTVTRTSYVYNIILRQFFFFSSNLASCAAIL